MRTFLGFAIVALCGVEAWAQETRPTSSDKADAYYYYCLGRMHEMQMQGAEAFENYESAVRLDPEAGYPHVALASLYRRTRQPERALESAKRAVELDPEIAAGHRLLGELYFSMLRSDGNPEQAPLAIEAFRNAVRLEPGDIESRATLARLLVLPPSRAYDEAAEHLAEIIRYNPSAYYEMFLLAQVRQSQGDAEAAIDLLKQSLAVEPRQPQARETLVELLQAEQRFGELAEVYRAVIDVDPTDLDARIRLADALANDEQLEAAAQQFENALAEDPTNVIILVGLGMVRRELVELDAAEELLQKALASAPAHVLARYTLASVYEQKRQYTEAIEQWERLVETPDTSPDVNTRRAEYWAHLGFAREQLDQMDLSIESFEKAKELSDGDARFLMFYIQGLLSAERADDAAREVDAALEQYPDNARFRALKARALDSSGDEQRALDMVLELAADNPDEDVYAQAVVDHYHRHKQFSDAEEFLLGRIEEKPDSVTLRFQLAASLERQSKIDEAEAMFEKILELQPDSAAALNYLGYMLADQDRRLDESLDFVQRALSQDPYNGAYLDSLGWVYFKMGELDLAEESLLKAIDSMRLTGVVYDHLGDLYFKKGDAAQAVEFWKKALDQDDDEVEKDAVAQKIERANSSQ